MLKKPKAGLRELQYGLIEMECFWKKKLCEKFCCLLSTSMTKQNWSLERFKKRESERNICSEAGTGFVESPDIWQRTVHIKTKYIVHYVRLRDIRPMYASCSIVCVSTVAKKGHIREDRVMDGGNTVSRQHIAALVMLVVNYGISHAIVLRIP